VKFFLTSWKLQQEKEDALKKLYDLEMQLDSKQKLELDIEQLKGNLEVMSHMGDADTNLKKKLGELRKELEEKKDEMEGIDSLNQTLIIKEQRTNNELEEAKKELIIVCIRSIATDSASSVNCTFFLRAIYLLCRAYKRCLEFDHILVSKEWVSLTRKLSLLLAKRRQQKMLSWHFYAQNGRMRSGNQNGILSKSSMLTGRKRCFISLLLDTISVPFLCSLLQW